MNLGHMPNTEGNPPNTSHAQNINLYPYLHIIARHYSIVVITRMNINHESKSRIEYGGREGNLESKTIWDENRFE
jgi:hypothetical protein